MVSDMSFRQARCYCWLMVSAKRAHVWYFVFVLSAHLQKTRGCAT